MAPRSRLEKYLSILEVLVPSPQDIETISYDADVECRTLKRHLDFLIAHRLIEERTQNKKVSYAITERGLMVFKTLQAQKYLEKMRSILPMVEEADEVGHLLSRPTQEFEEDSA
jgi:predicted transcriptional regulator